MLLATIAGVAVAAVAVMTPIVFRWLDQREKRAGGSELTIEGVDWVIDQEMSFEEFLQNLIGLDRTVLAGLTDQTAGDPVVKAKVFEKSSDTWGLVVFRNSVIVGYWSCFSLSDQLKQRVAAGQMFDSEITAGEVRTLDENGKHSLYFEMIGVNPRFGWCKREIFRKLMQSLCDFSVSLESRGIEVEAIYANAFSGQGAILCRGLGLRPTVESVQGGKIYAATDARRVAQNLRNKVLRNRLSLAFERTSVA